MDRTLKESQRILDQVERMSHLAHWERDLKSNTLTWSDEFYRIFGLRAQKRGPKFATFVELIHPDDRAGFLKEVEGAIEQRKPFHLKYRIVRPDGQVRYIQGDGEVNVNRAGKPCQTVGYLQDVTEQHLAEAALKNANRLLEVGHVAMQEILASIHHERNKFGRQVDKNVEEAILPMLRTLRQGATHLQKSAIEQIETCLREIASPFIDNVARAVTSLTPTELRICGFIRRGLAVKQIADLEYVAPETVSAHRRNIRRKLKISHRKINLTTYLREVFADIRPAAPSDASTILSTQSIPVNAQYM